MKRIDGHDRLAGLHVIAGADVDFREAAVYLGLQGSRAPRFDCGHILAALRHRGKRNGHRLHRHGAHSPCRSGRRRSLFLASANRQSQNNTSQSNRAFQNS